jgi:hypothetical protein
MAEDSWAKIKKDEDEIKRLVKQYYMKWFDITRGEDEQVLAGGLKTLCNYHLNNAKEKFPIGTIIMVVPGKGCPECDVATLGIYSDS